MGLVLEFGGTGADGVEEDGKTVLAFFETICSGRVGWCWTAVRWRA
jgi:hypothetical protein